MNLTATGQATPNAKDQHDGVTPLSPGALLDWPGGWLVVVDFGKREHSKNYGPCDFRAFQLSGSLSSGDILSTPWGACEIVQAPAKCRLGRVGWNGKRKFGEPGTPKSISATLAAAKAMHEELHRLLVEPV